MLVKTSSKRRSAEMSETSRLLTHYSPDVVAVLRTVLSIAISTSDLDNLLGYVKSESLSIHEPLLESLTENINPGSFFKLLIQHFGIQKCRLFCSPAKEHFVLMTSEPQHRAFLFTAQNAELLQMKFLSKERLNSESGSLLTEAHSAVREQFDEIVHCMASFSWMNLVHSSSIN